MARLNAVGSKLVAGATELDNSDNSPDQQTDEAARLRELEIENENLKKALAKHDEHEVAKGCTHLALEFCQPAALCIVVLIAIAFVWPPVVTYVVVFGAPVALIALVAHLIRKHYKISK